MASSSKFGTGRCIKWCTEPPNSNRSRSSPVFLFHNRQCYFDFVRELFVGSGYYHSVYLKQVESPIQIPSFTVEVYVGLSRAHTLPFSDTATVVTDSQKNALWTIGESTLESKVKYSFSDGYMLKFVFIFDRRAALLFPLEIVNQSVQTSNLSETKFCLEFLSDDLRKLLADGADHDVVLKCGERTIPAHKTVLRARSSVFAAMLKCDMLEGRTGHVELRNVDEAMLEAFVRYLYSGTVPELQWDTATKLYAVGDQYAVEGLKKRCAVFLAESLTPENACECLALADAHNDCDMKEWVIPYILDNGIPLLDDQWLPFVREHPALAAEVLRRSYQLQKQA